MRRKEWDKWKRRPGRETRDIFDDGQCASNLTGRREETRGGERRGEERRKKRTVGQRSWLHGERQQSLGDVKAASMRGRIFFSSFLSAADADALLFHCCCLCFCCCYCYCCVFSFKWLFSLCAQDRWVQCTTWRSRAHWLWLLEIGVISSLEVH